MTHEIFKVTDQKYIACVQHTRQNIIERLTTWRCVYTFTASGWRTCVVLYVNKMLSILFWFRSSTVFLSINATLPITVKDLSQSS